MNILGPAIFTPLIAIIFVAGWLIGTGELLLWSAETFGHTASIAIATTLMFGYTLAAWGVSRGGSAR